MLQLEDKIFKIKHLFWIMAEVWSHAPLIVNEKFVKENQIESVTGPPNAIGEQKYYPIQAGMYLPVENTPSVSSTGTLEVILARAGRRVSNADDIKKIFKEFEIEEDAVEEGHTALSTDTSETESNGRATKQAQKD